MHKFIESNPGFKSRFSKFFEFPDYTGEELYKIFEMYLRKNEYNITREAADYLKQSLDYAVEHKDRNFGNARYARNLFEKAIQCQANRLSKQGNVANSDLTEITLADIKAATK
jgi:Cdc6-like AAA superfamily ATPase